GMSNPLTISKMETTEKVVKTIQFKSDAPGRHSGTFDDNLIPDGTYTLLDVQGFDSKNGNRIFNNILQGEDDTIHVLMRVEEVQKTMPWITQKGNEGV